MPIYKSPTTSVREIDFKSTKTPPGGVPCIFVGTSRRGPAFVPVGVGNFDTFITTFGNIDAERFGPIAVNRWLAGSSSSATYIRLLGIGDGKQRVLTGDNAGRVKDAGYVVGQEQIQENGKIGQNKYATSGGPLGRSYVLGCFMSESNSTIFSDAGLQSPGENKAVPIMRGILHAASGVTLSLNTEAAANNEPADVATGEFGATLDAGLSYGDVLLADGEKTNFIVILNGHKKTDDYPNAITASFLPAVNPPEGTKSIEYAFNTDPFEIEKAGHYLETFYNVSENFAVVTGSQVTSHSDSNQGGLTKSDGENYKLYQTAFLLSSSLGRNNGSATDETSDTLGIPNFENYENRYTSGFSPFVVSQEIDGKVRNLFRFHSLDDGVSVFGSYKFTISNIQPKGEFSISEYPTFDLHIRKYGQSDADFDNSIVEGVTSLGSRESYIGLSLDPSSNNFISKRIGDMHSFFDFDKKNRDAQKVVRDGFYPNVSNLIRVETTKEVQQGKYKKALPFGFRGLYHMVTSGTTSSGPILTGSSDLAGADAGDLGSASGISELTIKSINQPPLPFRESLFTLNEDIPIMNFVPTWGFQVEEKSDPDNPNSLLTIPSSSLSFLKYFPDFHITYQNLWVGNNQGQPDVGGSILDADRYNNNFFSLSRIEVLTSSDDFPAEDQWHRCRYRRNGKLVGVLKKQSDAMTGEVIFEESRFIKPSDLEDPDARDKLKFTFPLQGGFDGTNIFNKDKVLFSNNAVLREYEDSRQGGRRGPTISAYNNVMKMLEDKLQVPGNLLFTPGLRDTRLTGEFLETCSDRFSTFYVMDLEEKDNLNKTMTGSTLGPFTSPSEETTAVTDSVKNTRINFVQGLPDNSFGACYYPDVLADVEVNGIDQTIQLPPSVAMTSVYSSLPEHSRPLGITRGALPDGEVPVLKLSDKEYDEFYQSGINVIASDDNIPTAGPFARSQRTFQKTGTGSKISVRRMLIKVRRIVGKVLRENLLFEKGTTMTINRARGLVENELVKLKAAGVFKSFKVKMDTSGTGFREDMTNNVIKGKVLIMPLNDAEEVILDIEEAVDSDE